MHSPHTISEEQRAKAIIRLKEGEIVALPTETVYGLAADGENEQAVQQIYALKGRPSRNPLIVHISDIEMAKRYVIWNERADRLAREFWPGALTLILPLREEAPIAPSVLAGGDTLAIRMPAHPIMREVIHGLGRGLAAPSANKSGRISPTNAAHVRAEFRDHKALMIIDGGSTDIGLESTVINCIGDTPTILRPGAITHDAIAHCLNSESLLLAMPHKEREEFQPLLSPGMLTSHYAPSIPVRLDAQTIQPDEAMLCFGEGPHPMGARDTLNLSQKGDLEEAARHLYAYLRALDTPDHAAIAVTPIPKTGIGIAINDRLKRAAAEG